MPQNPIALMDEATSPKANWSKINRVSRSQKYFYSFIFDGTRGVPFF